jgi:hypothetical protein
MEAMCLATNQDFVCGTMMTGFAYVDIAVKDQICNLPKETSKVVMIHNICGSGIWLVLGLHFKLQEARRQRQPTPKMPYKIK